jgi:hypothetical protein
MKFYRLSHLDDGALRQGLRAAFGDESTATAKLIAYIAEYDARQLYREDGYPSMHSYCVGEFKLSDDAACRRIHAARAARQFPAIFEALAKGLLNLTAVNLLAPWLTLRARMSSCRSPLAGHARHRTVARRPFPAL